MIARHFPLQTLAKSVVGAMDEHRRSLCGYRYSTVPESVRTGASQRSKDGKPQLQPSVAAQGSQWGGPSNGTAKSSREMGCAGRHARSPQGNARHRAASLTARALLLSPRCACSLVNPQDREHGRPADGVAVPGSDGRARGAHRLCAAGAPGGPGRRDAPQPLLLFGVFSAFRVSHMSCLLVVWTPLCRQAYGRERVSRYPAHTVGRRKNALKRSRRSCCWWTVAARQLDRWVALLLRSGLLVGLGAICKRHFRFFVSRRIASVSFLSSFSCGSPRRHGICCCFLCSLWWVGFAKHDTPSRAILPSSL